MKPVGLFPRVAYFTDCYHEINGIATTSRQLAEYARRGRRPMMIVNCGPEKRVRARGSVMNLELRRGWAAFSVERDFGFDLALWRHYSYVKRALQAFQPDVIHVTSPGDFGLLGLYMAHRLHLPLVASWHTNLHEFAGRRLKKLAPWAPAAGVEDWSLRLLRLFYGCARVTLAPNPEWVRWLSDKTGKPCLLMHRGVDSALFDPSRRRVKDGVVRLGFVGRISPEKNVRFLAQIESGLVQGGYKNFRFVIVGDGAEIPWLKQNLQHAEFRGVLRGEDLAQAYADMDIFVFPSHTDTFGNVVLEAMASGVAPVVSSRGGPKYLVQAGVSGLIAEQESDFITHVAMLLERPERLLAMRQAAREHAIRSTWDEAFEPVYEAYKLALANRRSVHAGGVAAVAGWN